MNARYQRRISRGSRRGYLEKISRVSAIFCVLLCLLPGFSQTETGTGEKAFQLPDLVDLGVEEVIAEEGIPEEKLVVQPGADVDKIESAEPFVEGELKMEEIPSISDALFPRPDAADGLFPDGPLEPMFPWESDPFLPFPNDLDEMDLSGGDGLNLPVLRSYPSFQYPSASSLDLGNFSPLAYEPRIPVKGLSFPGSSIFDQEELEAVVRPFIQDGHITSSGLQAARIALAKYYANGGVVESEEEARFDGYVATDVVIPDQDPNKEPLTFRIHEGRLTQIDIKWTKLNKDGESEPVRKGIWDRHLKKRIERGIDQPFNRKKLEERLQIVQQDPNIKRINAELKPGDNPGERVLDLNIEKNPSLHAGVDAHNNRPPSVGAEQIEFWAEHTSLTGHSDQLSMRWGVFDMGLSEGSVSGLDNYSASYSIPFTRWGTTAIAGYESNNYTIIEEPFDEIDIEGAQQVWRVGMIQPLLKTKKNTVAIGAYYEQKHSETSLLDIPFSLTPGAINGEIDLTVLRFFQEWTNRGYDHVFALRSVFGFGLDPYGIDVERTGEHLSWLGEAQLIRRLTIGNPFRGKESEKKSGFDVDLVLRGALQLASEPLFSPEQYALGGGNTVRGYRENSLVRDMGYATSAELRIPVWHNKQGRRIVALAPFFDYGGAWNYVSGGEENGYEAISSVGLGILLQPTKKLNAAVYWGHAFTEFQTSGDNLQDEGVHFRIGCDLF